MSIWTLEIPGYAPTPLNKLFGCHWATAAKRKAHDRDVIGRAVAAYQVPPASGKRRVRLLVILPKGRRACDVDAMHKSLLDALVAAGALTDDNRLGVELAPVRYARGEELTTVLTLEDC